MICVVWCRLQLEPAARAPKLTVALCGRACSGSQFSYGCDGGHGGVALLMEFCISCA